MALRLREANERKGWRIQGRSFPPTADVSLEEIRAVTGNIEEGKIMRAKVWISKCPLLITNYIV